MEPDYQFAHCFRGLTKLQLHRDWEAKPDFERAVQLGKDNIAEDPESSEVFFGLGMAYRGLGRLDEAIESLLVCTTRDPLHARAFSEVRGPTCLARI